MLRVYRIPFSTNVERVALAAAYKSIPLEWIDVDPADRSPVVEASGQELVPVLDHDGRIVFDSTAILYYLDELQPEPRLFTSAEVEIFVDWFNRVWKVPPNAIEAERGAEPAGPGPHRRARCRDDGLARPLRAAARRPRVALRRLLGRRLRRVPFLKYALERNEDDDEPFHEILRELLVPDGHALVEGWIRRVDATYPDR